MIILNIYIASIVFALFGMFLLYIQTILYAKRHKLTPTEKKTTGEKIFSNFKAFLSCCIPLYNIFWGIVCLIGTLNDKIFEAAVEKNIQDGTFKYKEDE